MSETDRAQHQQIAFAAASRAARRGPRSLSVGKNRAGSASRQAPANCQFQSSRIGAGNRPGFVTVLPLQRRTGCPPTRQLTLERGPRIFGAGRQVDVSRRRHRGTGGRPSAGLPKPVAKPPGCARNRAAHGHDRASAQLSGIGHEALKSGGGRRALPGGGKPRSVRTVLTSRRVTPGRCYLGRYKSSYDTDPRGHPDARGGRPGGGSRARH